MEIGSRYGRFELMRVNHSGFDPRRGRQYSFLGIDQEIHVFSFSPFRSFKKGSCQFLAKECAQYWLTEQRT